MEANGGPARGIGADAAASIVTASYAELLAHPPDATVLRTYTESLANDAVTDFPLILRHLNSSSTAGRVRVAAILRQIGRAFSEHGSDPVRPVVSLGTTAYTGWLLNAAGLLQGPQIFDTIAASPRMVAHCLDDDFATLLRADHHERTAGDAAAEADVPRWEHAWYRANFGVRSVFAGLDPTDAADRAAVLERIAALRSVAQTTPATYVLVAPDTLHWEKGFAQVSRALHAYAPLTRLLYAVVRSAGPQRLPRSRVVFDEEEHALVEFTASTAWSPAGFASPLDDVTLLALVLERL